MTTTPILVSLWGGPGAGKTTWALRLAHELKNNGYKAEYVSEMAKDYAWEKSCKFKYPTAPWTLIGGQLERIVRPAAECDVVITDACPYMSAMYMRITRMVQSHLKESVQILHKEGYWTFAKTIDIFVDRKGHKWLQYGRHHTFEEAQELDKRQLQTYISEMRESELLRLPSKKVFKCTNMYSPPAQLNVVFPHLYEFIVNQLPGSPVAGGVV